MSYLAVNKYMFALTFWQASHKAAHSFVPSIWLATAAVLGYRKPVHPVMISVFDFYIDQKQMNLRF